MGRDQIFMAYELPNWYACPWGNSDPTSSNSELNRYLSAQSETKFL